MGVSVWSSWDDKPITQEYTREAEIIKTACLRNALNVFDSVLKPPTVIKFYGAELTVTANNIYVSVRGGNAYIKACQLAKATDKKVIVHDVVKSH